MYGYGYGAYGGACGGFNNFGVGAVVVGTLILIAIIAIFCCFC